MKLYDYIKEAYYQTYQELLLLPALERHTVLNSILYSAFSFYHYGNIHDKYFGIRLGERPDEFDFTVKPTLLVNFEREETAVFSAESYEKIDPDADLTWFILTYGRLPQIPS